MSIKDHIYTNHALIISSCQARQCHPETSCCRKGEGAIKDYIEITEGIRKGETYYGIIKYGNRKELEEELKQCRKL